MSEYHPDNDKLVANWFDPHNEEHLRAWREANRKGWWPQWFQDKMAEEGVEPHGHWSMVIQAHMAELWVESKIGPDS